MSSHIRLSDEELARLKTLEDKDGNLDAEVVLEDAKSEESPLHHRIQWDDNVAAHGYRIEQVTCIIRSAFIYHGKAKTVDVCTQQKIICYAAMGSITGKQCTGRVYQNTDRLDKINALSWVFHETERVRGHLNRCAAAAEDKRKALPKNIPERINRTLKTWGKIIDDLEEALNQ